MSTTNQKARPDEPLGDGRLLGVEAVQICMRLALFEEKLDLPTQAIEVANLQRGKSLPLKIRVEIDNRLLVAASALVERNQSPLVSLVSSPPIKLRYMAVALIQKFGALGILHAAQGLGLEVLKKKGMTIQRMCGD